MEKKLVTEVVWLRTIACLAVVLVHSLKATIVEYNYSTNSIIQLFTQISMFGTPIFIFISVFLIAKFYPNGLPKGFFAKRAKFLLIPYVCMGIIYAVVQHLNELTIQVFFKEAVKNIFLANFTVYFVLIIFQFYVLYALLHNKLRRYNPQQIIAISFFINIGYLGFFNFIEPFNFPLSEYLWYRFSWYPFLGWIFYFTVGYYSGRNHTRLVQILIRYKNWILFMPVVALSLVFFTWWFQLIGDSSSKRVDNLVLTTSIMLLIFYLASKKHSVPVIVTFISQYGFSIYLLHKIFITLISAPPYMNSFTYTLVVFVLSIFLSIVTSYLLNKVKFGMYIVGNIVRPSGKLNYKKNNQQHDEYAHSKIS